MSWWKFWENPNIWWTKPAREAARLADQQVDVARHMALIQQRLEAMPAARGFSFMQPQDSDIKFLRIEQLNLFGFLAGLPEQLRVLGAFESQQVSFSGIRDDGMVHLFAVKMGDSGSRNERMVFVDDPEVLWRRASDKALVARGRVWTVAFPTGSAPQRQADGTYVHADVHESIALEVSGSYEIALPQQSDDAFLPRMGCHVAAAQDSSGAEYRLLAWYVTGERFVDGWAWPTGLLPLSSEQASGDARRIYRIALVPPGAHKPIVVGLGSREEALSELRGSTIVSESQHRQDLRDALRKMLSNEDFLVEDAAWHIHPLNFALQRQGVVGAVHHLSRDDELRVEISESQLAEALVAIAQLNATADGPVDPAWGGTDSATQPLLVEVPNCEAVAMRAVRQSPETMRRRRSGRRAWLPSMLVTPSMRPSDLPESLALPGSPEALTSVWAAQVTALVAGTSNGQLDLVVADFDTARRAARAILELDDSKTDEGEQSPGVIAVTVGRLRVNLYTADSCPSEWLPTASYARRAAVPVARETVSRIPETGHGALR